MQLAGSDPIGVLETLLDSSLRRDVATAAAKQKSMRRGIDYLVERMRSHSWGAAGRDFTLAPAIDALDQATRAEGLHVLHDWNGKEDRVTDDSIAVASLKFASEHIGDRPADAATLAVAIDYYFLYLLALLAMRSWDEGEPGANLDRVTALLAHLQGPHGSGQRMANDAETLLLIATSHFEPSEAGYDKLLARARALPPKNRVAMAITHAQAMGGHLRFGYEVTYGKDFKAMRDDNGADYPWLLFGLSELMDEWERREGSLGTPHSALRTEAVVEALINGLTPDPTAVLGRPVSWFDARKSELDRFLTLLDRHRATLLPAMEAHRPREAGYWPIALFFNFSQNVLKGAVVDALFRGQAAPIGLNELFGGPLKDPADGEARANLARRLTGYARLNPDTIRGRLSPVIVYDPVVGRQHFGGAIRALKSR
jgi:hypothetical protein